MIGHPTGCQCDGCIRERQFPQGPNITGGVYAYAASWPWESTRWAPVPALPCEPSPAVVMYMVQFPRREPTVPSTTITFTPPPDSPEMVELRALREEVRNLAKTQDGMSKLIKRFLEKGKKS